MKRLGSILGAVCALLLLSTAVATARQPRVAVARTASLPHGAHLRGTAAPGALVSLDVGLAPRDPLALHTYATAVSDPHSSLYGAYLTTAQFAARFGAPDAHVAAVIRALRADGLHIAHVDASHLTVDVSGRAAVVSRALDTRIARVALGRGRSGLANTRPLTLPASVGADVAVIEGLNPGAEAAPLVQPVRRPAHALPAPRSQARPHVATGGPQPCSSATAATAQQTFTDGTTSFGYTADLIASYYGFTGLYAAGHLGAGASIALPEGEFIAPGDINGYQGCYGTATPVNIHPIGAQGDPTTGEGDSEVSLDVDQIIGLAPQATIDIYSKLNSAAPGNLDFGSVSSAVSANADRVVSISYGGCESDAGSSALKYENTVFEEAAIQGQTVVAGSGDTGSQGCTNPFDGSPEPGVAADDYATQPFVLGVGGTSLFSSNGASEVPWNGANAPTESVWNVGSYPTAGGGTAYAASGGGISSYWKMPTWQSGAAAGLGVINPLSSGTPCHASSGYCREDPDVSAIGDISTGYAIYANSADPDVLAGEQNGNPWTLGGGTSASTPLWATIIALTNTQAACRGVTLGAVDPLLYQAAGTNYAGYFRDITAANPTSHAADNDVTGTVGGTYPTTPGYDMTTGLGSPLVAALAPELCALRAPVLTVAIKNPGTRRAYLKKRFSYKVVATDSGGRAVTIGVKGLPKGLKFSAKTNKITGTPRKLGRSKVTITAADDAANVAAPRRFTIRVRVTPKPFPKLSGVALHGVAKRHPTLTFSVTKVKHGVGVRTITIRIPRGLSFSRHNKGVRLGLAGRHHGHHKKIRFTTRRGHGRLTIRLKSGQPSLKVTIGRGTLSATKGIATTARKHKARKTTVRITLLDVQGYSRTHAEHLKFKK